MLQLTTVFLAVSVLSTGNMLAKNSFQGFLKNKICTVFEQYILIFNMFSSIQPFLEELTLEHLSILTLSSRLKCCRNLWTNRGNFFAFIFHHAPGGAHKGTATDHVYKHWGLGDL